MKRPDPFTIPERQANFGFAIAGIDDIDGDGRGDLVATSPDHSGAETYSGGAFALSGDPNLALRSDYLLAQIDDPNVPFVITDGQDVTVNCASGETGYIYKGKLDFHINEINLTKPPTNPAIFKRWIRLV